MRFLPFLLALLTCTTAAADDLVIIAPVNQAMPLAHFNKDGEMDAGMLRDIGEALARRLGRTPRFVSMPSKRVPLALASGEADVLCHVMKHWIDGDFVWSAPFLPSGEIIAARPEAPAVRRLGNLAGQPIGTVLGYRYPLVEDALGKRFVRDDAQTMEHNFRKLVAGRMPYAIVDDLTYNYYQRAAAKPPVKLRRDVVISSFRTHCAFSRKGRLPAARINQALDSLIGDGSLDAMLARYQ